MALRIKRLKELARYFFDTLHREGVGKTLGKTAGFFKARRKKKKGRYLPCAEELARQRADKADGPLISVVTALYNTPPHFLQAFLDSISAQTYARWQLCLADASDPAMAQANRKMVEAMGDERMVYIKLGENGGISANTNAAAALAAGAYIAFADHDDCLAPHALYEMAHRAVQSDADWLYSDEALFEKDMLHPRVGHFKPDFSPDYLRSCNYICHLLVVRRSLFQSLGGLRPAFDGAQDHDFILRLSEATTRVEHVAKVLYYWRVHSGSTSGGNAAKPYVAQAGRNAVAQHLARIGADATVEDGPFGGTYRVRYTLPGDELVSILIPNKDHVEDLEKLLSSLYAKTLYRCFEVVVIENNSQREETFAYYRAAQEKYPGLRVVYYKGGFNYSAINNFGRRHAQGQYLLLLNNDMEIITPDWLGDMLGYCRQPGVGAVGAKLLYPDDTVQHAGVIVGLGGYAGHNHKYFTDGKSGYMFRLAVAQNLSAVTGACLLVPAAVYDEVGGLDEQFTVAYNDVDFCLRIGRAGYRIVEDTFAKLYHYESKSRGSDEKGESHQRFLGEQARMKERYGPALLQDPYYNPFLTLDAENFAENAVMPKER